MDRLSADFAAGLLEPTEPPCLSLYQPTQRHHPESRHNAVLFRNLVKKLEESLLRAYPKRVAEADLRPFHDLAADDQFWFHPLDGLAVLGAPGVFRAYKLQRPVPELAIAADRFHIKPLIRIVQSADRYQVLGISRDEVKLYEGNRDVLDQVDLHPAVPRTVTDALGEEVKEPHLTVASYGNGARGPAMHHGHGARKEELDKDTERFFRAVDQAVSEHHSNPSRLPLLIAGLPQHRALYHKISRNSFLVPESIGVHPEDLQPAELGRRAWQAMEPRYLKRLAELVSKFGDARAQDMGSGEPARVAKAAVSGRVGTLLLEADREVPGRVNRETAKIERDDMANPAIGDLLDDLGHLVLRMGGEVIVVPAERMPTQTGLAGIYRF